jgi:hypothetical protein
MIATATFVFAVLFGAGTAWADEQLALTGWDRRSKSAATRDS